MNICAKLNICASNSATSPSREPLAIIIMNEPNNNIANRRFWEIVILIAYIFLSVEFIYFLRFAGIKSQENYLSAYAIITQFLVYTIAYRTLRNIKMYIYILLIGGLHLLIYFILLKNAQLIGLYNSNIPALRNTLISILIFQFLRFISLKTQHQELVCITRNKKDIFEERETTVMDSVLFLIYLSSICILLIIK